jgi:cytochrome c-type biogenesis protein CcmH/NrfG
MLKGKTVMPRDAKALKGYVKTSNMYLTVLVALSVGFLGGVLFSAYRSSSALTGGPGSAGAPSSGPSAGMPLNQEQSQKLAALLEATKATPDNIQAWTQLGHFYFDTGKHPQAIEAYQKSLALDENRPNIWTDLGVMYRRAGQPKKAVDSFDRALSINNRHETAMFNKGVVLMHDLDDPTAAVNAWESLVKINPSAKAPNGRLVSTLVTEMKKKDL